jgi:6-phosphogluconolactonase
MTRVCTLFAVLYFSSLVSSFTQTPSAQASPQSAGAIAASTTARYAYAVEANVGDKNPFVVSYSISPQSGYLRPVESKVPVSDNFGVVVDPSNKFLYLPDGPQIIGYRIAVNGALQALKGSPFNLVGGSTIVFTPNGQFAYSNLGSEFSFNSTTGALAQIGAVDTGGIHEDIAIDPTGSFVYILNASTISAFSVDKTSGALAEIAGSPFDSGESDGLYSEAVSPDGKFLFVTTFVTGDSGFTAVFSIDATSGALTPVVGSPFISSGGSTIVDSTSQYLYVGGGLNLAAYSIDSATGVLTSLPGSPYTLPAPINLFTLDPTANFLYASLFATGEAYVGASGIITFSINSATGALTQIFTDGSFGEQVEAVAITSGNKPVVYTPKFAYVANQGSRSISEWTINSTGALTAVSGSPITDSNGPQFLAATSAHVYTGNANNSISEYSANSTTGALTLVTGSPITGFGSVNALAADPTGSYLYVLDSTKQFIDSYSINPKTGALTFLTSVAAPPQSQTLVLDATGAVAVVTSASGLQTYNVASGVFVGLGSATLRNSPGSATFDQSTQYVFVTEPTNNAVVTFNIIAYNGVLTQLSSAATGKGPSALLAEPSGKYVYVANTVDGTVSAYSLMSSNGALTQIGSAVTAAAGTDALSTSNDGKYLYATNSAAGLVSIFKIGTTGSLTSSGTATTGSSPTSIVTIGIRQ